MSGKNPNNSENETAPVNAVEDNHGFRFSSVPDPSFVLDSRSRFYSPTIRMLIPAWLRYGFYRLSHRIRQAIRYESETGAKFLVLPVAFGTGCLAYFSLPREPLLIALLIAVGIALFVAVKTYGSLMGNIALVALFVFGGMAAGKLRSDLVDTTMIVRSVQVRLTGIVLNREQRANGRQRYTILVDGFENDKIPVPEKIRVTAHAKHGIVEIGQPVQGIARLRPPSGPAYPGGYDFAFQSWYNGIGANGFFLGAPDTDVTARNLPLGQRLSIVVAQSRLAIGRRIRDALPGESGSLAAALIVGDRSGISEETVEQLRRSGLAHILAISGLHMALVTATIIFLVRGTLAMVPTIALYYPIRKWAAISALIVASIYLVISGAGIATQRAWIMIVIMLLAIVVDRRALTMRNVGLAALLVLAWRPESIVSPSFQMSFAAVAALVAVYESWSRYRRTKPYQPSTNRFWAVILSMFKSLSGLAVTSVVAGAATGLFAAYHFHRIAPFGLLANLAAMPLVSVIVMPMALLAMILMPFGLESWPLELMGYSIDQVVSVAAWVADLGTFGNTGFLPLSSLLLGTIALVTATQLKSVLRYLSLPLVAAAAVIFANASPPDILVSESGSSIAVFDSDGHMYLLNPRKEKFITNIWRKAYAAKTLEEYSASSINQKPEKLPSPFRCDELACTAVVLNGSVLSIVKRPEAYLEDCERSDIIVTKIAVPEWCTKPRLIIDKRRLQARGAIEIRLQSLGEEKIASKSIETKSALGPFIRPWTRHRN